MKHKIRYVSIKLPACWREYPLDNNGCRKIPEYTTAYLEKHGRKVFKALINDTPATVYSEVLRCFREKEKL